MSQNDNTFLPANITLDGGRYVIIELLKSGGFGNTYKVREISSGRIYAMKEFFIGQNGLNTRIGNSVTVSNPSVNEETFLLYKKKFIHEVQRVRKLNNEHIIKIFDAFEENNTAYYVMEYLSGGSLRDKLNGHISPLEEKEAVSIFYQILDALSDAHSAGIIHADITPNNIMFGDDDNVVLIDFGNSKEPDKRNGSNTTFGVIGHTLGYAPLEQMDVDVANFGPWTDFYSLGATLYNLLTLKEPPSNNKLMTDPDEAFDFSYVDAKIQHLIRWMMTPNRKKRPQSVQEIKQYLQKLNVHNSSFQQKTITDKIRTKEKKEETIIESEKKSFSHDEETVIELNKRQAQPIKSQSIPKSYVEVKSDKKLSLTIRRIYAVILLVIFMFWIWGSIYISKLVCDYLGLGDILQIVLSLILMSLSTFLLYYPIDLSEYMDKKE